MCIDGLPGCEYYLILFYGGEFLHLIIFCQKRKKEEKEKPRKTITTALPPKKTHQIILACSLKDSKSQNMKHN